MIKQICKKKGVYFMSNLKKSVSDFANEHKLAVSFYLAQGDKRGEYYVDPSGYKIELYTKKVYSPTDEWLYTPAGTNIFRGEYDRFIEALFIIEQYKNQSVKVVNVQTPIGILNVSCISADMFAFQKDKEWPDYKGKSKAFLVNGVVYYEQFTCHDGYSGTCNCFSHSRRQWATYPVDNVNTRIIG